MQKVHRRITVKVFFLLLLTDVLETLIQLCFKKSALSCRHIDLSAAPSLFLFVKTAAASPYLWLALFSVLLVFVIWSVLLSRIDLSVATPVASFSYIGVPLAAMIFLHETISLQRWGGIVLILAGVALVSLSTIEKDAAA